MHIITVSVTVSLIKIQPFNDFKEGFVYRIREKKDDQKGNKIIWIGLVLGG